MFNMSMMVLIMLNLVMGYVVVFDGNGWVVLNLNSLFFGLMFGGFGNL